MRFFCPVRRAATLLAVMVTTAVGQTYLVNDSFFTAPSDYYAMPSAQATVSHDSFAGTISLNASAHSSPAALIRPFTPIVLGVGDYIRVQMDWLYWTTDSAAESLRWLLGSVGYAITSDLSAATLSPPAASLWQFSASTNSAASSARHVADAGSPLDNDSGTTTAISGFDGFNNLPATEDTFPAVLQFQITRTGTTSFTIEQTLTLAAGTPSETILSDLATSFSLSHSAAPLFDTLFIGFGGSRSAASTLELDNLAIVTTVPEPSSLVLMILALLGLAFWRGIGRRFATELSRRSSR